MDDHFEEEVGILDELEVNQPVKRSTLLTVLCILTWVGCSLVLLSHLLLFSVGNAFYGWTSTAVPSSQFWFFLEQFVFPAGCVVGAIFMWRLNRWGYIIYLLGQAPPIIYTFIVSIFYLKYKGSEFILPIYKTAVPIAFVIFYGTQLSNMKSWKKQSIR